MKESQPKYEPERFKQFMLVCDVHGELGYVPSVLIRVLEQGHRDYLGCLSQIKVYEKEKYEAT